MYVYTFIYLFVYAYLFVGHIVSRHMTYVRPNSY